MFGQQWPAQVAFQPLVFRDVSCCAMSLFQSCS